MQAHSIFPCLPFLALPGVGVRGRCARPLKVETLGEGVSDVPHFLPLTSALCHLLATPSAAPTKGTTLSKRRSPGKDVRPDAALGPTGQ